MATVEKFLIPEEFGQAKFLGDDPAILELSPEERVFVSGWRHACPNPNATINYYGGEWLKYWEQYERQSGEEDRTPEQIREHGVAITRRRYDECDRVFGDIVEIARKKGKTDLLAALTGSVPRRDGEPMGVHEVGRVPHSHEQKMSPLSKLVGYALPRVIIEQFGWGDDRRSWGDGNRTWPKYEKGYSILENAVKIADTPTQLLALIAEEVYKNGGKPEKLLGHILAPGIELEENNHVEFQEVRDALAKHAKKLWEWRQLH